MIHNIVDNAVLGTDIPATSTTTQVQVYRNTDNKIFKPTCLVIVNPDTDDTVIYLSDADLTDTGEDTHKTKKKFAVEIKTLETVYLDEDMLKGLAFRYGVCMFPDGAVAATECEAYIAGYEI